MAKAPIDQQQDYASQYGWSLAVLRSAPELSKLFDRSIAGGYNQARFVAELRNTAWYRQHSESVRQALVLQKADPTEYKQRVLQYAAQISDQYYALTGRRMGGPTAAHLGQQAFQLGMNDAQMQDLARKTVSSATLMKGGIGGTLGEAERQLRQASEDFGIDLSETYIKNAVNNIAWQNSDATSEISKLRQIAVSKYPAFAKQLQEGQTIKDIAEPYKQLMSKTLEISDQSIKVTDRQIQNALTYAPKTAKEGANNSGNKPTAPTGMPLWQFEQTLKNDPRYMKTKGAQDAVMSAGRQVLTDLGFLGAGGN